ncbi:MAG: WG repeat-containing protein [Planctomycetota bacterium]
MDHSGKFVIPPQFDEVYDFSGGWPKSTTTLSSASSTAPEEW